MAAVCRVGQCDTRPVGACSKPTDAGVVTDVGLVQRCQTQERPMDRPVLRCVVVLVLSARRGVCCSDACLLALCRPVLPSHSCVYPFHAGPVAGLPFWRPCSALCAAPACVRQLWLDAFCWMLCCCRPLVRLHNQSTDSCWQPKPARACSMVCCSDSPRPDLCCGGLCC